MTTKSTSMSMLRVGSSDEILSQALTEAVIGYLQQQAQTQPGIVTISNKYFEANVALRPIIVENNDTDNTTKEDGILLVFDDSSKQSFNVLADRHAQAESSGQHGDLLRLCIGLVVGSCTTSQTAKEREKEYSRRVLWCLDHGYEYVEKVDLGATDQGHEEREKEGFARVIEAIRGTVWSTAVMHAKKKQTLQQSYQQTQSEILEEETKQENENTYEPPPTTLPLADDKESQEREERARQALLEQDGVENDQYLDGKVPSGDERQREQKSDKVLHDMEGALKEANRIRDMSRAGEISDEDRKKRAGDAAVLIMNLMNQMGGMEEESEEESDNEEQPAAVKAEN